MELSEMRFYCFFNKTFYIILLAFCLINDVIYRKVLPALEGEAISYYIADLGVKYNTQKKHCCQILPGKSIKHMTNDENIGTVQIYNASKGTSLLRIHGIKETRFCRASQKLSFFNNCWLYMYMIIKTILQMKWFEITWLSIFLRWAQNKLSKWTWHNNKRNIDTKLQAI